nr:helix-turn-helix transcriptional regulator [Terrabacter sp. Soil810]
MSLRPVVLDVPRRRQNEPEAALAAPGRRLRGTREREHGSSGVGPDRRSSDDTEADVAHAGVDHLGSPRGQAHRLGVARTGRQRLGRRVADGPRAVVLRWLTTMMSVAEIADELCVSTNTVKTHVAAVYRKLGVAKRRDAVSRGRELRLL